MRRGMPVTPSTAFFLSRYVLSTSLIQHKAIAANLEVDDEARTLDTNGKYHIYNFFV